MHTEPNWFSIVLVRNVIYKPNGSCGLHDPINSALVDLHNIGYFSIIPISSLRKGSHKTHNTCLGLDMGLVCFFIL